MDTKLTLKLEQTIIEKAKDYAKHHRISLSKLIESYLKSVTEQKKNDFEITPLVESLIGVIHLSEENEWKNNYSNYLMGKYK